MDINDSKEKKISYEEFEGMDKTETKKKAAAATVGLAALAFGVKLLGKRRSNKY